jgi:hypothetical protein
MPNLSRARNPNLEVTELRVEGVPKPIIDFIDGKSVARGDKRRDLVIEILAAWVRAEAREMIVVQRVVGGNPVLRELAGMEPES